MKIMRVFFKILLCVFFVVAGTAHFLRPGLYLEIMPPYIPYPLQMVYVSGFFEVALGLCVVIPKLTRLAAWGLILLLIAVFPANLHMALHPQFYPDIPLWGLYARLPLQGVFILWAYWFAKK